MIEITTGTLEERIIKLLRKIYPVTIEDIKKKLNISGDMTLRTLKKLQIKGIVILDPLPDKIYVRLLRYDFRFIGKKRQRKFIKHRLESKQQKIKQYDDDIMYS